MIDFIRGLGRWGLGTLERLGRATLLLLQILTGLPELMLRFSLVVQQLFYVGVLSVLIILVSGLFVGMVLGLQGYNTLVDFGAEESLGVLVSLSLATVSPGRAGVSGVMPLTPDSTFVTRAVVPPSTSAR